MASTVKQHDDNSIAGFYDWLAPEYDRMTGFEQRFEREKPVFQQLVSRYGIRTAVDAGCGTGFLSLLLARLGVEVTAADLSPRMLQALEAHAGKESLPITVLSSSFLELGQKVPSAVDALFCLGNSLPHLLAEDDLRASLRSFAAALRPGGLLVLQTLNYDRILASQERVQSVKETGGITYVRFYDFEQSLIRFNILKLSKHAGGISHELRSVFLRPILQGPLLGHLTETGFTDLKTYGGLSMEEFGPEGSRDLVVLAVRRTVSDSR